MHSKEKKRYLAKYYNLLKKNKKDLFEKEVKINNFIKKHLQNTVI